MSFNITESATRVLYTIVSLTNTQGLASRFFSPLAFLPKIFLPRYIKGAGIPEAEARELVEKIPSLSSKPWTHYWMQIGDKFVAQKNYQAACMTYILGCFPKEDYPWKTEINKKRRQSFRLWCESVGAPFEEREINTPYGSVRFYITVPKNLNQKIPLSIFINGLEGSSEEFAFPLASYIEQGLGFAILSIPGSADYDRPMSPNSDELLRAVIDDIVSQPWVDTSNVGMVGFSFGAYWTLICAKTHPKIRFALCNGIPYRHTFNVEAGMGLNPVISYALLQLFGLLHPVQLINIVKKLYQKAESVLNKPSGPILFLNGDNDTIVDPRDTQIAGSAPNHRVLFIKNDDHCGLYHYERMVSILVGWIKRCINIKV